MRGRTGSNWNARSYPNAPYSPRCSSGPAKAAMISRSAENTVGWRLRSSSVNVPAGSGISTSVKAGSTAGPPAGSWPARRRAASMTGMMTVPRSFSARALIRRPRATTSTHGST